MNELDNFNKALATILDDPKSTKAEINAALSEGAELVRLEERANTQPQVDALLLAGWTFELPEIENNWKKAETEPWQWYWRRPARRKDSKGQRFLSTNQAYNALQRQTQCR